MSLNDVPMSPVDDGDLEDVVVGDVPMSPVDDADLENVLVGTVRKLEEVVADTGTTGRSIRKVTSPHDDNVMVTLDYVMNMSTEFETIISYDDMLTSIQKTEFHNKISNDGLKLPKFYLLPWTNLPAMAKTLRSKDFSLLQKYVFQTDPSSIKKLSFEEALKHELVATCVWFLLTKECPRIIKEGLASALQLILFIAPNKATDMPIAKGESVVHARRISVDQKVYIDTLVVGALCLDDGEIIRQVSEAIGHVVVLYTTNTVSTGIQSELVKLARRFPFSSDSQRLAVFSLLRTINTINSKSKDGFMREELFQAVLSDCNWLLDIMDGADDDLLLEAYHILEGITSGKYDEDLWEALRIVFVPAILNIVDGSDEPRMDLYDIDLVRSAATVISNTINKTSSRDAIWFLAEDLGCLRFLVGFLGLPDYDGAATRVCMEAIEKILEVDEDDKFTMMIGEDGYLLLGQKTVYRVKAGWHLLHNDAPNSKSVVSKYAPEEWQPDKFAEISLRLGEGEDDIVF